MTLQGNRTDSDGQTTEAHLTVEKNDKPHNYKLTVAITSPNRTTNCEKVVYCNPASQISTFVTSLILISKVCKRSPNLLNKIGSKMIKRYIQSLSKD